MDSTQLIPKMVNRTAHRIQITERYNTIKDHTGVIVYTPDDVTTDAVIGAIYQTISRNRNICLNKLLDDTMEDNWDWKPVEYDGEIRLPVEMVSER